MKKRVALVLALALISCSQQEDVQNAIKARLKDPGSAQFQRVVVSEKGDQACAIWNARNSFGGYGEWRATGLRKGAEGWQLADQDMAPERCTDAGMNAFDRFQKAQDDLNKALAR